MSGYDIVVVKADGTEKRVAIERSIYHIGDKDCDLNFPNAGFKGYGLMVKILGGITITPGDKQEVKLNGAKQNSPFDIGLGDLVQIGELSLQVVEHGKPVRKAVMQQTPTTQQAKEVEVLPVSAVKPAATQVPAETEVPIDNVGTQTPDSPPAVETIVPPEQEENKPDAPPLANITVQPVVRKREAWESAATAVKNIATYERPGIETQKLSRHNINTQNQIPCEFCGKLIRPIVLRCPHCKNDRTEIVDQAFEKL